MSDFNSRFFETTRGRIVQLLRPEPRTVNDLAAALNLTDNAVRAHLATLERDRLVRQRGLRAAFRKPNFIYELTDEADRLFPKAYGPILAELLDVLRQTLPEDQRRQALREVGRRLAAPHLPHMAKDLPTRLTQVLALLKDLGGLAQVEVANGQYRIQGSSCPLSAVVQKNPEACQLAESLLTALLGTPVHERCQKGSTPHCCFDLDPDPTLASP